MVVVTLVARFGISMFENLKDQHITALPMGTRSDVYEVTIYTGLDNMDEVQLQVPPQTDVETLAAYIANMLHDRPDHLTLWHSNLDDIVS